MGFLDYPDIFFISPLTDKVFHILNINVDVWVTAKPHNHICLWDQKPWLRLALLPWTSPGQIWVSLPSHVSTKESDRLIVLNDSMGLRIYAELVPSLIWLWGPTSGVKFFALIRRNRKKQWAKHEAQHSDRIRHTSYTDSSTQSSYS